MAVQQPDTKFIGAGTELRDLIRAIAEQPLRLVDIGRVSLAAITERPGGARASARTPATAIPQTTRWCAPAIRC